MDVVAGAGGHPLSFLCLVRVGESLNLMSDEQEVGEVNVEKQEE
jgi:hypothetical protein